MVLPIDTKSEAVIAVAASRPVAITRYVDREEKRESFRQVVKVLSLYSGGVASVGCRVLKFTLRAMPMCRNSQRLVSNF